MEGVLLANSFLTSLHLFIFDNLKLHVGPLDCHLILITVNTEDFALSCFVAASDDLHKVTLNDMPVINGFLFSSPGESALCYWVYSKVSGSKFIGEHHFVLIIINYKLTQTNNGRSNTIITLARDPQARRSFRQRRLLLAHKGGLLRPTRLLLQRTGQRLIRGLL